MYRLSQIKVPLDYTEEYLLKTVAQKMRISENDILNIGLYKKSVDARKKDNICFVLGVDAEVKEGIHCNIEEFRKDEYIFHSIEDLNGIKNTEVPVIVGTGPAGIFCAYTLAKAGLKPVLIERGNQIAQRVKDVELFEKTGVLNTESNIQFGEGGAGTFSDGKLTTGINDIRINEILKIFNESGAPDEILYESKPHIGTDILREVMVNLRNEIVKMGGKFLFKTKLEDIVKENDEIKEIVVSDSDNRKINISTKILVIAIGHSARDTIEMLHNRNISMIQKPFSVGVRIEHKQLFINKSQYKECFSHPALGAADYKLYVHLKNSRGVYSFCMCPGGYVAAAASEEKSVCVNGMSKYKRDGENANSAVLVSIFPSDFKTDDPMEGIRFQRKLESNAYSYGGGEYKAPVQLADDFIRDFKTTKLQDVIPTYPLGYQLTNLSRIFPKYIDESLKEGIFLMNNQIRGFTKNGAVLTGVESRSSSPVRMVRNEKMQSNIKGIYPCGEGAGYAGGIMSSAVDGMKAAEAIIENYYKEG